MAELEEPVAKREVPFAQAEAADKRRSNEEMMGKRRGQFAPIEIERREQGKRGGEVHKFGDKYCAYCPLVLKNYCGGG